MGDNCVGISSEHEGVSRAEPQTLQVGLHPVQNALEVGPVNDIDPDSHNLKGEWVPNRLRKGDVELMADILLPVIIETRHQLRLIPVALRRKPGYRILEYRHFLGILNNLAVQDLPDLSWFKGRAVSIGRIDRHDLPRPVQDDQCVVNLVIETIVVQKACDGSTMSIINRRGNQGEACRHGLAFLFLLPEHEVDLVRRVLRHLLQRQLDAILGNLPAADKVRNHRYRRQRDKRKVDHEKQKLVS